MSEIKRTDRIRVDCGMKRYTLFRTENAYWLRSVSSHENEDETVSVPSDASEKDTLILFTEIRALEFDCTLTETKHSLTYGKIKLTSNDGKRRKLTLLDHVGEEGLTDFFSDVASRIVRNEKKDSAHRAEKEQRDDYGKWVRENRNPSVFRFLRIYSRLLYVLFPLLYVAQILLSISLMPVGVVLFVLNYVLALLFPTCFSVSMEEKKFKALHDAETISLPPFLALPAFANVLIFINLAANPSGILVPTLALTALLLLPILLRYLREYRMQWYNVLAMLFFLAFAVFGTFSTINLQYSPSNPLSVESATILEKDMHSSRKSRSYDVTVQMPDGEVQTYDIRSSIYKEIEEGDNVLICTYGGLLGTTYTIVFEEPTK